MKTLAIAVAFALVTERADHQVRDATNFLKPSAIRSVLPKSDTLTARQFLPTYVSETS
jgi:hypothetical protein